MKVVITGGGGFLGQHLAQTLLVEGVIVREESAHPIEQLVLFDRDFAERPDPVLDDPRAEMVRGSVTDAAALAKTVEGADVVFHLAAIVSSQAEADFDLGMEVNVDGSRALLEACRAAGRRPRVVFTSSVAVFGPVQGEGRLPVDPRSSYGAEKAIGELLLSEYSRRGFVDGVVLRLPTISVRPGKPNKAASSFASGIIREPLAGEETICPVSPDLPLWLLSPRHAVANLIHAARISASALKGRVIVDLPGLSVTVAQMVAALEEVAGSAPLALIRWERDPAIERIVANWPSCWDDTEARALGFTADATFADAIRTFLAESDERSGAVLAIAR